MEKRWRLPGVGVALGLIGMLCGCGTVGPDYHLPARAVAGRAAAAAPFAAAGEPAYAAAELPPRWWRLYRDEGLERLIEKALAANADLRVAAANLARARAVTEEFVAATRPAVSVNAAPGYGRSSAAAKGLSAPLSETGTYDAGGNVSYQLDLFGKLGRAVEAAHADAEAAQAALDVARITVVADTARAYADACSAGAQMRIAQHSVDLQQQLVQLAERYLAAGRGTALDVSRARSQLGQLLAAVPPLQAQRKNALYRLAVLTGEVPQSLPPAAEQCSAAPRVTAPIPVGDGAALLRRRPDIRQAERNLAAATARIGVATAELYPSITLGLSAGSTGTLANFGQAAAFRWSLGPLISWTIPSTGAARAHVAQAEAGGEVALARFDSVVLAALRETESALTNYARELDRNAALELARDQGAVAAEQARALYRLGRSDFSTTLDADRSLASAESALAASTAQLSADQIALFLALGGGWEAVAQTAGVHPAPADDE